MAKPICKSSKSVQLRAFVPPTQRHKRHIQPVSPKQVRVYDSPSRHSAFAADLQETKRSHAWNVVQTPMASMYG